MIAWPVCLLKSFFSGTFFVGVLEVEFLYNWFLGVFIPEGRKFLPINTFIAQNIYLSGTFISKILLRDL